MPSRQPSVNMCCHPLPIWMYVAFNGSKICIPKYKIPKSSNGIHDSMIQHGSVPRYKQHRSIALIPDRVMPIYSRVDALKC